MLTKLKYKGASTQKLQLWHAEIGEIRQQKFPLVSDMSTWRNCIIDFTLAISKAVE